MKSIIDELSELFGKWKNDSTFIADGLMDSAHEERYVKSKKILFLLREPGRDSGESNLCKIFMDQGKARWNHKTLARFAYGLENCKMGFRPSIDQYDDKAYLSSALMNLRKEPSVNDDTSYDPDLLDQYVDKWKGCINQQLRILAPEIIVCCGVKDHLKGIVLPGRVFHVKHPANRDSMEDIEREYNDLLGDFT